MAYINRQPGIITTQPQVQYTVNPFHDFNQEWTVGLCDCCTDVGQCTG